MSEVLEDCCLHEYFIQGADGFFSNNISKKLSLVNSQRFVYHSINMETKNEEIELKERLSRATPGSVITLLNPPLTINVALCKDDYNAEQIALLRKCSLKGSDEKFLIVPITTGRGKSKEDVVVKGGKGYNFRHSKVTIKPYFPLEPGFAMTVNKSEGRTLEKVILAISNHDIKKCNFSYKSLYVAFSRVRKSEDIRLLLSGKTKPMKWESLVYITKMKSSVMGKHVLKGFNGKKNHQWQTDQWDMCAAYKSALNEKIAQRIRTTIRYA